MTKIGKLLESNKIKYKVVIEKDGTEYTDEYEVDSPDRLYSHIVAKYGYGFKIISVRSQL
jgi:hypothetical protein